MKDAKGHGSSKRGVQSGGQPMSSNREAAQNFVRALAKTMQPVPQHDSMRSAEAGTRAYISRDDLIAWRRSISTARSKRYDP